MYNRMLYKNSAGRKFYDIIRSSAINGICPLCSIRTVASVDHYLPKSLYPVLAITPMNLIPSCNNCNEDKDKAYPQTQYDQSLHPYFDNINNENWIKASVQKTNPISLVFYSDPPKSWNNILKKRATHHFKLYKLHEVFSSHAITHLIGHLALFRQLDSSILKSTLWDFHVSNKVGLGVNSYQSILYYTLFNDDWFCNTGVYLV